MEQSDKQEQSRNELEKAGIRFHNSVEAQDLFRLKEAINRTDKEKFDFLMNLMKIQEKLKQGTPNFKSVSE